MARSIATRYPRGGSALWLGSGAGATLLRDEFFGPTLPAVDARVTWLAFDTDVTTPAAIQVAVSEGATALDINGATLTATVARTVSELAQGVDQTQTTRIAVAAVTEQAQGVDQTQTAVGATSAVNEQAQGADQTQAASAAQGLLAAVTEQAQGVDQTQTSAALSGAVTEQAQGVDQTQTLAVLGSSVTEQAQGVDQTQSARVATAVVNELAQGNAPVDASQTTTVVEGGWGYGPWSGAAWGRSAYPRTGSDFARASDAPPSTVLIPGTIDVSVGEQARGLMATGAGAAVQSALVEPGARGSDVVGTATSVGASTAEQAQGLDVPASTQSTNTSTEDSARGADNTTGAAGAASAVASAATGQDTAQAAAAFVRALTELAHITLAPPTPGSVTSIVGGLESARGSDTLTSGGLYFIDAAETARGAVVKAARVALRSAAEESAVGADAGQSNAAIEISFFESVSIQDLLSGRFLWNPVDDNQPGGWQNVPSAQVPGWADVNDSSPAQWQPVTDAQGSGWVDVNDANNAVWLDVD